MQNLTVPLWFLRCKGFVRVGHISPLKIFVACSLALNIKLTGCDHWFNKRLALDLGNIDNSSNFRGRLALSSLISEKRYLISSDLNLLIKH